MEQREPFGFWLVMALIGAAILILLTSCTTGPVRLGLGDCAVLDLRDQVVVAGSGCDIQRVWK